MIKMSQVGVGGGAVNLRLERFLVASQGCYAIYIGLEQYLFLSKYTLYIEYLSSIRMGVYTYNVCNCDGMNVYTLHICVYARKVHVE